MESKRVPRVGETWRFTDPRAFLHSFVIHAFHGDKVHVFGDCCHAGGDREANHHNHTAMEHDADLVAYVSGPSDAPAKSALPQLGETWRWDNRAPVTIGEILDGKQDIWGTKYVGTDGSRWCDVVNGQNLWTRVSPAPRITQAAVADELEKRAKDIPLPVVSVGDPYSPVSADGGSHTEAARGGEAAVSRADTMWRQTSGDVAGGQKNIDLASPDGHCNLGVACNVCVPPVKRVPWVDSLPVDWWLPDAV